MITAQQPNGLPLIIVFPSIPDIHHMHAHFQWWILTMKNSHQAASAPVTEEYHILT